MKNAILSLNLCCNIAPSPPKICLYELPSFRCKLKGNCNNLFLKTFFFFPSYILEKLATYSCEVQQKTLMCNSRPRDENEALAYKKLMQSSKRPPIYYINRILCEKEKKKQKKQTFLRQTVK